MPLPAIAGLIGSLISSQAGQQGQGGAGGGMLGNMIKTPDKTMDSLANIFSSAVNAKNGNQVNAPEPAVQSQPIQSMTPVTTAQPIQEPSVFDSARGLVRGMRAN